MTDEFAVRAIGYVESALTDRGQAPRQGDEGAPDAWLVFAPDVADAWADLAVGDELTVLTFLHLADRSVLSTRPRSDPSRPLRGVFSTRGPDRPNPIGLHDVRVLERRTDRLRVANLEAVDGTPVLDIKPVLGRIATR